MAGPNRAEIWQVNLSGSKGHEQKGERPAILWRDLDHVGLAIIVPLTSNLERQSLPHTYTLSPSPKNNLKMESVALVFQLTVIDKRMLLEKIGELDEEEKKQVGILLKELLRL